MEKTNRRASAATAVAALALLAACQGVPVGAGIDPDRIERDAVIAGAAPAVAAEADRVLRDLGLEPVADMPGRYRGDFDRSRPLASCPVLRHRIRNQTQRLRMRSGYVDLWLSVAPADGGARVQIAPTFVGIYGRPDGVGTFENPCNSFGTLEQDLFARLRGTSG